VLVRLGGTFDDGAEFVAVRMVIAVVVRIDESAFPGMMMVPLAAGVDVGAPERHALRDGQQGHQEQ